jgi:type IV pilus assembly protein PilC
MFTAMSVDLPLPTKILISVSNFLSGNTLYLLIAVAVLAVVVLWLVKQPSGRRLLDRLRLSAPIIGTPTLMGELARLSRTMSVLISAGLNLQEVMAMIPQSSNNRVIRDALNQVNEGLLLGGGLSEPMSRIGIFPPLLVQMVAVGEESNTLDFTLGVVADFYEVTAEEKTSAMVGMIGPLATIVIALGVGFIAISVLMPMYTLTGAFG